MPRRLILLILVLVNNLKEEDMTEEEYEYLKDTTKGTLDPSKFLDDMTIEELLSEFKHVLDTIPDILEDDLEETIN